jgi:hypothetical protein
MPQDENQDLAEDLVKSLCLQHQPLAISFTQDAVPGVEPFADPMPAPTADGRTGRVAAGCVFWIKAEGRSFSTVAEDHANCSVGSVTHGFKTLNDVNAKSDVSAAGRCRVGGARYVSGYPSGKGTLPKYYLWSAQGQRSGPRRGVAARQRQAGDDPF